MMKSYQPTKRQKVLDLVLQYDSHKKTCGKSGFFSDYQRMLINQERAKIMSGDNSFLQYQEIESKIDFVIDQIVSSHWQPEKSVRYE